MVKGENFQFSGCCFKGGQLLCHPLFSGAKLLNPRNSLSFKSPPSFRRKTKMNMTMTVISRKVARLHSTVIAKVPYPVLPLLFLLLLSQKGELSFTGENVLANCLAGLRLPRNSAVRLTDHSDMTIAVYHRCKQQHNNKSP